ncbi:MAG: bifunctional folylpolyglutamate synthase/dihydrofolate synthase, partial [Desulfarculus sp.]|nr:bifunctional folylpolyglutamate synthase/dihydrofolate synthase [Desulfarculus sp.]
QPKNAALALGAVEALARAGAPVTPERLRQGLATARRPGRLQQQPSAPGEPTLWLDGAHNLPAARALVNSLDLVRQGRWPLVMVLGVMADKDLAGILGILTPAADRVVYSRPRYQRAAEPAALAAAAPASAPPGQVEPDLARAIQTARRLAGPGGAVLVTGSLFTVGEALALLTPGSQPDRP